MIDLQVPEITDGRVHGVVARSANTTFIIEHLGCGCDIEALYSNATAFAEWKQAVFQMASESHVVTDTRGRLSTWRNNLDLRCVLLSAPSHL